MSRVMTLLCWVVLAVSSGLMYDDVAGDDAVVLAVSSGLRHDDVAGDDPAAAAGHGPLTPSPAAGPQAAVLRLPLDHAAPLAGVRPTR